METKKDSNNVGNPAMDDEVEELLAKLEQKRNWDGRVLVKYEGFWCPMILFRPILSIRKNFEANDTDIILATLPKSGTTWLKALTFSIVNRNVYTMDQSPLLTSNPHKLVPFLEVDIYLAQENPDLQHIPCPRIFSVHMPFKVLPQSILESKCKIIYICRNPLDQFISYRHFLLVNKSNQDGISLELEESFDLFCQGIHPLGPFWDHMLGYWNAHLKSPESVLFLKYEDLKEDILLHVRKIGEFLGCPFSEEEEKQGLIEKISRLCSFEKLSGLEANKSGTTTMVKNSSFFRKGEVGDWKNHLTPAMAERMKNIMDDKLYGSGLTFKT